MREGWQRISLGEIATIRIGRTPPRGEPTYWTAALDRPFCTISDMTAATVRPTREGVTELAETEGKAKRVPASALLLSFKLTIGRVGFAAVDLFPNEAIAWVEPTTPNIDKRYLGLWLGHQDLVAGSGRAVKGDTLNKQSLHAISVEFPPIAEQLRIANLVTQIDDAIAASGRAAGAASRALHLLREDSFSRLWETGELKPLGELIRRVRRPIEVDPLAVYHELGVRSHGRGTFHKSGITGSQLGSKHVFSIEPGDLILNIVFAWERAVAVATPADAGRCGSHRFPTYVPREDTAIEYVLQALLSERGRDLLGRASPGSAGRNRTLSQGTLLQSLVPHASLDTQLRFVTTLASAADLTARHDWNLASLKTMRSAILSSLLAGDHEIPDSYDRFLDGAA